MGAAGPRGARGGVLGRRGCTVLAVSCSAHRFHVPRAPACDSHHVIPQAWQRFAQARGALWDRRTVELCPNCHRGVHERIVAYVRYGTPFGRDRLSRVAEEGVTRFEAYGGSLAALRAAGLYGQQ